MIKCPQPKKLCKTFFFKEHRKKIRNQILKLLNYKHLLTKTKTLILKNNQINFVKNIKSTHVSYVPLCDLSKIIFPHFL